MLVSWKPRYSSSLYSRIAFLKWILRLCESCAKHRVFPATKRTHANFGDIHIYTWWTGVFSATVRYLILVFLWLFPQFTQDHFSTLSHLSIFWIKLTRFVPNTFPQSRKSNILYLRSHWQSICTQSLPTNAELIIVEKTIFCSNFSSKIIRRSLQAYSTYIVPEICAENRNH